jgi:hypothetical protein
MKIDRYHSFLAACPMLLLVVALAVPGCSRAIKEGVGLARGARGVYVPLEPLSADPNARPLGEYEYFELGSFTDGFGGKTPPELFAMLPEKFREEIVSKKLPDNPAGPTLVMRGEILHYESENLVGVVIGPLEEVIARVELVDKASGRVLATGNCVGRTKEAVNQGVEKKAEGLAKALASWIEQRYPEPPKEQ